MWFTDPMVHVVVIIVGRTKHKLKAKLAQHKLATPKTPGLYIIRRLTTAAATT